jgi:hypothetical protein
MYIDLLFMFPPVRLITPDIGTASRNAARCLLCFIFFALLCAPMELSASDAIPKQVNLVVNCKRLIASNIRLSRFDELNLRAQEEILERAEAKGVIVVITNQRIIGYGLISGWRDLKREAGENVESLLVEDFAAFITTDRRLLNFNGQSGVWGKRDRRTER